ncbi:MAG TPA: hypothetical protein VEV17_05825 [Bryobacteraceae bacterium]|nr:hypothetical protein [Bryobacteraceae bacterium]
MNPLDSENWIYLATRSEMEGRSGEAEKELLRAFEVDRQFEPRWALANFYFRTGNSQAALAWARKTLDFGAGNLTSVFQLCWTVSGNAGEILDKAVPHRAEVLAQYLQFLDGTGRVDEAGDVAKLLLPLASPGEVPMLAAHCTRSLEAGQAEAAIAVWNGLIARGLIAQERVEPRAGRPSVDTGFQGEMNGQGFAWGVQPVDGISVQRLADRRGVRVVLSRNEPEHSAILRQWIALASNRIYRYRITYAASGMDGAGLKWVIYSPRSKAVLMSAALRKDDRQSRVIEARFESPADGQLAMLELRYDREPGTVRPEGSIVFSGLALQAEQ